MQRIECFNCGKPLNLNIKASTGYIYETKPGRDDKPRARFDKDGKPVKGEKAPPVFHLGDQRTVTQKVLQKREVSKGVTEDVVEEVTSEEPNTRLCPHCGFVNKIY